MKKRILSILAAMLVAVSAAGCGSTTETTDTTGRRYCRGGDCLRPRGQY